VPKSVWMLLVLLGGLALTSAPAGASADPYADQAQAIGCPSGPSGWTVPAGTGRAVLTPLTNTGTDDGAPLLYGGYAVEVDCHYFTGAGEHLEVSVRYALPIDINPFNDFDIGCTVNDFAAGVPTGAYGWNTKDRVYRVVGETSWAYATFYDYLGQLGDTDVSPFEAAARSMLKAAQPIAHQCVLAGNGKPVDIQTIWDFGFDAQTSSGGVTSTAAATGSFVTKPSSTGIEGVLGAVHASDIRLVVKRGGKTHAMTIRIGDPLGFQYGYVDTLRTAVTVVASNDPVCRAGSTGTLAVSSLPQVSLKVCGRVYLKGAGRVRAQIVSV